MATVAELEVAAPSGTRPRHSSPSLRARILVAFAVGEVCGAMAHANTVASGTSDWAQIWYGSRALLHGVNPYAVVGPGRLFEWGFPLLYPVPALMVGMPFALAPLSVAVGLFVGFSVVLLSFGLTRDTWHRLVLLLSAPVLIAILYGQWSILLASAVLLSPLGFVLVVKPTIGAALWAYRPSIWSVIGGGLVIVSSIAIRPSWVREWLAVVSHTGHMVVPIAHSGGVLLVLALLKWRRPESRLLLALACVPQTALPYEVVPLLLVPATLGESLVFVALSYVAAGLWVHLGPYPRTSASIPNSVRLMVLFMYLPCLIMVLRRPNEGALPQWLVRGAARLRSAAQSRI